MSEFPRRQGVTRWGGFFGAALRRTSGVDLCKLVSGGGGVMRYRKSGIGTGRRDGWTDGRGEIPRLPRDGSVAAPCIAVCISTGI